MKLSSTTVETNKLIFVVDDDKDLRKLVCRWLELEGFETLSLSTGEDCLKNLDKSLPACILLDLTLPSLSGIETLTRIKIHHQLMPVVMMTADTELESVVTTIKLGAFDYLSKPLERLRLISIVNKSIAKTENSLHLRAVERENSGKGYEKILGQSAVMRNLFKQLDSISFSDITVLIQGASGTGKELIAQAIHATSSRKNEPFVALNCAAIPENLQESELFGYEKGAFTSANTQQIGKIEQAHKGTLFFDEVGEMNLGLQAKLLRVLQERSFQRLGGSKDINVDFRLITASHVNLAEAVKQNKFRDDLYYRIAVFELEIPTLAERKNDIPLLAQKFIADFSIELNKPLSISSDTLEFLKAYNFPGNIRELQNALHRASVVCQNGIIEIKDLPKRILEQPDSRVITEPNLPITRGNSLESTEKKAIEEAIVRANGNLSEAIRQLGIGRATFYRKLKKFGIR
jgi:two-component system, NtrC family, response regulator AtoC